jgi:hypothetical protein
MQPLFLAAAAIALAVGAALVPLAASATPVDALSCHELWVKRNWIYKKNGYCFKTAKARSYFGNAGCYIDDESDVSLSKSERKRVLSFRHWEEVNGC